MIERLQKYKWFFLAALFAVTCFVWYVVYREDRHGILTVAFLDVGQGDSVYIEAPNGNQILLDGGADKKILKSLGSVMPFYDRSIDLLVLSHPHLDHFGGFLSILPRYVVSAFVSSGTISQTPEYKKFQKDLGDEGIRMINLKRGQQIDLGDGVLLDVLLPDRDVVNTTPHDGMLVIKLQYGKTSVMLTGDMEKNLEDYLIALDSKDLKSDILKVGHHGSQTSTSDSFLGYVSPETAIMSVGVKNKYGHPHEETIDRLNHFGVNVARTDEKGTVIIKSDGEKLMVVK